MGLSLAGRAAWRRRENVCEREEKSLPDRALLVSALNQKEVRQLGRRGSTVVCGLQAKRAMRNHQGRSRPAQGICRYSRRVSIDPLRTGTGANFNARRWTSLRNQGVRHRGRDSDQEPGAQHQPDHPRAACAGQVLGGAHDSVGAYQAQCLWAPCPSVGTGAAPAGAICDTGTLISDLLSTPLASLKTKVRGMVVSFCRGSFRSISITW